MSDRQLQLTLSTSQSLLLTPQSSLLTPQSSLLTSQSSSRIQSVVELLCEDYRRRFKSDNDAVDLINVIARIAIIPNISSDLFLSRFYHRPCRPELHDLIIDIGNIITIDSYSNGGHHQKLRPSLCCKSIEQLARNLNNGVLHQPTVPFTKTRSVRIIANNDYTIELHNRAINDEIDVINLCNRVIIVEPSMEPATDLMWKSITGIHQLGEDQIKIGVLTYQLNLLDQLNRG